MTNICFNFCQNIVKKEIGTMKMLTVPILSAYFFNII